MEGVLKSNFQHTDGHAQEGLLILVTNSFPGGNTEPFLNEEINHVAKRFRRVVIFTFGTDPVERQLPANVERIILPSLWDMTKKKRWEILRKEPLTLMKMLAGAVNENGFGSFLKMRTLLINRAIYFLDFTDFVIGAVQPEKGERVTAYSYWGDHKAVIPALLRKRGFADYAISRAHGFEIYDQSGIYNFYRDFQYRHLDAIVTVSADGKQTMAGYFPKWKDKVRLSRLGTVDLGLNPLPGDGPFRICSCSKVHEIKRVPNIAKVIGSLEFETEWVHFGAGPQLDEVKEIVASFPSHIKADLKGHVRNEEVLEFYRQNPVDLFVNFSVMEGVPVSIMEAMSFGIPTVATSAGGMREIVNEKTGKLLDLSASDSDLRDAFIEFRQKRGADQSLRSSTRRFWKENYSAAENFSDFADHLARGDF